MSPTACRSYTDKPWQLTNDIHNITLSDYVPQLTHFTMKIRGLVLKYKDLYKLDRIKVTYKQKFSTETTTQIFLLHSNNHF